MEWYCLYSAPEILEDLDGGPPRRVFSIVPSTSGKSSVASIIFAGHYGNGLPPGSPFLLIFIMWFLRWALSPKDPQQAKMALI